MSISTDNHTSVPFHLSLNVADLKRSIDFFGRLFDLEAAKQHADYAKFEVADPPLVLSLEPNEAAAGARLNHLGVRLPNCEQLVDLQRRLELAGIACQREDGVECCYSKQTKFWVTDPDRNLWEFYTVEEDLDHRGLGRLPVIDASKVECRKSPAPSVWVHRLSEPILDRLPIQSETVDQVLLQGSFNIRLAPHQLQHLFDEARRILKPGGQLTLHGLTADRAVTGVAGRLPGPAAAVDFVPAAADLLAALEAADFEAIRFTKFSEISCFAIDDVPLRETQIVGYRRQNDSPASTHAVFYKGPFKSVEDDRGRVLTRGTWVAIDGPSWNRLHSSSNSDQFEFRTPTNPT